MNAPALLTRRRAMTALLAALAARSRHAAAAERKLVVGALLLTPSAGFFIGKERGYFRDAGIEVELKAFTNAQQIATAVVSGDLDIGLTRITAGLYDLAGKGGLRIIGATAREEPGYHLNAFLATNDAYAAGLRRVADIDGKRLGVTADQASELSEMLRLLGEPNRLNIVANCLDGPLSVGEITGRLGLSQSLVSHHLRLLRAARLLKAGKRGKQVFYSLPDCHVREMLTNMVEHLAEPHEHENDQNPQPGEQQ